MHSSADVVGASCVGMEVVLRAGVGPGMELQLHSRAALGFTRDMGHFGDYLGQRHLLSERVGG